MMQQILLGYGAGGSESYWYATIGDSNSNGGNDVAIDNDGNVYLSGASNSDILVVKYDKDGTEQWQRLIDTNSSEKVGIGLDSSNNVYVVGDTDESPSQGSLDFHITKFNSSGTEQWQKGLGGSGIEQFFGHSTTDSSGNTYGGGYTTSAGQGTFAQYLVKWNSSGTVQWQRTLSMSGQHTGRDVSFDSSGNVYMCGESDLGTLNNTNLTLAKWASNGTHQWTRYLRGNSYGEVGNALAVDSSDNIYVCVSTSSQGAGSNDLLLVKYNSSGTVQWRRLLGGTGSDGGTGVAVDSSDNVYVCGTTRSVGNGSRYIMIAKIDSSGNLQWQNTFGGDQQDYGEHIKVDSSNNIYVVGRTQSLAAGQSQMFVAKLPNDGSLTGLVGDAEKNSFKLSGMGGSRMGEAGYLRFFRKKSMLLNSGEPFTINMFDESNST
jgi:hypothetical protein